MKVAIIPLVLCCTVCGTAQAQSAWNGPYAGASVALFSGENTYNATTSSDFPLEGEMLGVFAGYNVMVNNLVIGGELAIMAGDANEEDFADSYSYTSIIDLKGRVGFDYGNVMPYGLIGASIATLSVDDTAEPNRDFDQTETGLLIGIGAEYAINDQFNIGAELVTRAIEFEFPDNSTLADMEANIVSISLRGSYQF